MGASQASVLCYYWFAWNVVKLLLLNRSQEACDTGGE